jgi:hypothetical protein
MKNNQIISNVRFVGFFLSNNVSNSLEEVGCDNREILSHCRGPGQHVKKYWVVDLIHGKEGAISPVRENRRVFTYWLKP